MTSTPTALHELINAAWRLHGGRGTTDIEILRGRNMHQENMFDAAESQAAKERGMRQAADKKARLLRLARNIAYEFAETNGTVTADDVARILVARGVSVHALGNVSGSIFREKHWEWTGRFIQSARLHAHKNLIRVWRLRG